MSLKACLRQIPATILTLRIGSVHDVHSWVFKVPCHNSPSQNIRSRVIFLRDAVSPLGRYIMTSMASRSCPGGSRRITQHRCILTMYTPWPQRSRPGGSGRIHYTEWLTATMRPDKLASDKAMEQATGRVRTVSVSPATPV